jgi:hypothetical protein
MAEDRGGPITTIIVAVIGTAGVIGAAWIASGHSSDSSTNTAAHTPLNTQPSPSQTPAPSPTPTPTPSFSNLVPQQVAPGAGEVFTTYPRNIVFRWLPLPGAQSYRLEIQYCDPDGSNCIGYPDQITTQPSGFISFIGAQPGKWRVTGLDANGQPSRTSDWRIFSYTK